MYNAIVVDINGEHQNTARQRYRCTTLKCMKHPHSKPPGCSCYQTNLQGWA